MPRPGGIGWAQEVRNFIKAQFSSGAATFVDWALLSGLILVGLHYLLAICAGAVAGAITDFALKRWWAFRLHQAPVKSAAFRYLLVSGASLGFNCALAYGLVDRLHAPKIPGAIGASIVVAIAWNYPLHRLYVFGTHGRNEG